MLYNWRMKISTLQYLGVLLVVLSSHGTKAMSECADKGWLYSDLTSTSCYYYIPSEATFNDGKNACRHLGGKMIAVSTSLDSAAVTDILQTKTSHKKRNVWLDMVRTEEDEWQTTNGSDVFIDWHEGYPEGKGDCGVIFYENAAMKNKRCSLKAAVLCVGTIGEIHTITSNCSALSNTEATDGTPPGTYAYVTCDEGYEVTSYGHKKSFCKRDGTWGKSADQLAECQAESCSTIAVGEKVIEINEGGHDVGNFRNFTCPPGSMFESQKDLSYILVECNRDGQWISERGEVISLIDNCVLIPISDGEKPDENSGIGITSSLSLLLVTLTSLWTRNCL